MKYSELRRASRGDGSEKGGKTGEVWKVKRNFKHRNTLRPRWRRETIIVDVTPVVLRVYFNYGYAQLMLMDQEAKVDETKNAYLTLKPPANSTLQDIQKRMISALEVRKMEKVSAWATKFGLVDKKSRKQLRSIRPFLSLTGKGSVESPYEVDMVPRQAPEKIDFPNVSFQVIKHLSFHRKQPRIITLTNKGIQNIKLVKGEKVVTSERSYAKVFYTAILDEETLVVSYTDAKEHKYRSKGAIKLVQTINERVSAFLKLEREYVIQHSEAKLQAEKAQKIVFRHWKSKSDLNGFNIEL
ncbi:hypothetical protein AAMO2058_001509200 [Amorphochlora amoebiformis]